ncbi:MAG: acyl-CoA dehydrogenase family protein [Robiginitomaculum sp.]
MTYQAPINAIQYLLRHSIDLQGLCAAHAELSDELITDILSGASQFATEVLAPINRVGDEYGAKIDGETVTVAPEFKDAYKSFVEAGWQGLSAPENIGGMSLPQIVSIAVNEMIYAANMAFGLCPMLTGSSINAIIAHADQKLKDIYLGKMVSGEWTGAMNLTEPQAGSDLGALRAKAVPNSDGTYAVSGQKIFITWGDHDCADNIIHLILARLPDAPEGSRGISLFLAPKMLVNEDGSLGEQNNIKAIGLEHKLGIHGSPTCVMEFDHAKAWMVGQSNKGLACMFTMMNEARQFVGVQGVAIGERAYQAALAYAGERVQGKVLGGDKKAPILGHPDVRRMLMDMKAGLMGARAINMATSFSRDISRCVQDETIRKAAHAREALLTPIAKAYGSDMGVSVSSTALQVHGGMGFIEETGAAQHYRDSRIAPIYEGTNGIQAMDLVSRKVRRDNGATMRALIEEMNIVLVETKALHGTDGYDFGCKIRHLGAGLEALKAATDYVLQANDKDVLSICDAYLQICGDVISGALLIKSVLAGIKAGDGFAGAMQKLTWHHALRYLSRAPSYLDAILHGAGPVYALDEVRLADL